MSHSSALRGLNTLLATSSGTRGCVMARTARVRDVIHDCTSVDAAADDFDSALARAARMRATASAASTGFMDDIRTPSGVMRGGNARRASAR
eukprot:CAMPEP_0174581524 /NCGR_PEP_ID=MMETSP0929-20130131/4494_1 /TAXON_ID=548131 ORGANISM="Ostreococcus mediterraneus, Strain clade-D-RCC2572" /NCGR_SAMPLE_ID=MMETSP0929 /ASSEMBLY_ACC=CAM_ASM_000573 /LENGTH=91 /DNA_ID=CAMNT_0015763145 /DNA_START=38 /DNA_END=309 /DNA_ORIENTATION=+